MLHNRGYTLIELLVLVAMLALLTSMLLFSWERSHRRSVDIPTRGIHVALVIHAQSNNGYYVGLDRHGQPDGLTVEQRYKRLIDANYLPPDYVVSSNETGSIRPWVDGPFTADHYSFALLQIPDAGGRQDEWQETLSPDAVVVSDRNTGTADRPTSLYSNQPNPAAGQRSGCSRESSHHGSGWVGNVVFNDNSRRFVHTHRLETDYGGHAHAQDHLFEAAGDDDAYLIHSGN